MASSDIQKRRKTGHTIEEKVKCETSWEPLKSDIAASPGLAAYLAETSCTPRFLYRDQLYLGDVAVNEWLNKEGQGIAPMDPQEVDVLRALPPLAEVRDAKIFELFSITKTEELVRIARAAKRELAMPPDQICFGTVGTSKHQGHPGAYPKLYRCVEGDKFPTDQLAQLHINRRRGDGQEVDEFMKVLSGAMEWFFLIEGEVGLLSLPAEWQITYHGCGEHGGYLHEKTRSVLLSQIVGPAEWEMAYTDTRNTLLDQLREAGQWWTIFHPHVYNPEPGPALAAWHTGPHKSQMDAIASASTMLDERFNICFLAGRLPAGSGVDVPLS